MTDSKARAFVYDQQTKEKFVQRLRKLIERHKSARAAAREWGLSFSTLNNYINRGTEPSFFVMSAISQVESVSMDWLAFGSNDPFEFNKVIMDLAERSQNSPGRDTWLMIYDNLSQDEQRTLISFCLKEGGRGMVSAVASRDAVNSELMSLTSEEKERLIRLHEQLKKGSPEVDRGIAEVDLARKNTKAG